MSSRFKQSSFGYLYTIDEQYKVVIGFMMQEVVIMNIIIVVCYNNTLLYCVGITIASSVG